MVKDLEKAILEPWKPESLEKKYVDRPLGAVTKCRIFFLMSVSTKYPAASEEVQNNLVDRMTHTVSIGQLLPWPPQCLPNE